MDDMVGIEISAERRRIQVRLVGAILFTVLWGSLVMVGVCRLVSIGPLMHEYGTPLLLILTCGVVASGLLFIMGCRLLRTIAMAFKLAGSVVRVNSVGCKVIGPCGRVTFECDSTANVNYSRMEVRVQSASASPRDTVVFSSMMFHSDAFLALRRAFMAWN
jgi:hypothetical protein